MSIRFEDSPFVVISCGQLRTGRAGQYYSLIVAPCGQLNDHWYANVYPEGHHDFGATEELICAQSNDTLWLSGKVRKYPLENGFGVVLDIESAYTPCHDPSISGAANLHTNNHTPTNERKP